MTKIPARFSPNGDVTIYPGEVFPVEIAIKPSRDGTPIDLSGRTFVMTAYVEATAEELKSVSATADGDSVTLTLLAEDTEALFEAVQAAPSRLMIGELVEGGSVVMSDGLLLMSRAPALTVSPSPPITLAAAPYVAVTFVQGSPGAMFVERGAQATIELGAVVTGEPGSAVSIENVGTPHNMILNFSIPGTGVFNIDMSGGTTGLTFAGGPITDEGTFTLGGTLAVAHGGTGATTATGTGSVVRANSPALVTPDLGTPSAVNLSNATALPLTSGVSGLLPVANGGTGAATAAAARGNLSAAKLGANSDITSLSGLTTALSGPQGGTGQATTTIGDLLIGAAANGWQKLAAAAAGLALISGGVGAAAAYGKIGLDTHVADVLMPAHGGLGTSSAPGDGQLPIGAGGVYAPATLGSGAGIAITAGAGSLSIANSGVLSLSGGTTGLTPATASTGALTLGGTLAIAHGGTGATTATGTGSVVLANSPALMTPNLGTPSAATLTNATGLPLTSGVTGILPVANGGTGVGTATGTGSVVRASSPALVTPDLGTPSAINLSNALALPLTSGVTGILPVANGGTGVGTATGTGSVVRAVSPTLTTPVLGDATATSITLTSGTIAAAPTSATDIANKAYVDGAVTGLSVKNSCNVATAAALPACTYANGASGVGATLTGNANGALTVDASAVQAGWRVLVKNQANPAHNGLFLVTQPGSAGAPFILTRATDSDIAAELQGAFTFIEQGTVNGTTGWANTNSTAPTIGTTGIVYAQFSGAGTYTAGTGLSLIGSQFSISDTAVTPGGYALASFTVNQQGQITGASSASTTGTGSVVLASSPTLTTPNLGTPSAVTLTNATGLPLTSGVTGTLPVGNGGTGVTSSTGSGANVLANGPTITLANATGLPLTSGVTGTLPAANGGTGLATYTIGDLLYASGSTALSKLAGVATGNVLLSGGVGTAPAWGQVGLTSHVTGTLAVGNGGTGATTLTGYLKGNGTSAFTAVSSLPAADISGTLGADHGGTGLASFTTGDLLYASAATTLSKLAGVATGNVLLSGGVGTAPAWGQVGLTSHVTGTLPTANGGTGLGGATPFTANGIPYASNASTLATSSSFKWNGTTLSVGTTIANASYAMVVKRATDLVFGIGMQSSELTLEAFNESLNANVPMQLRGSTLKVYAHATSPVLALAIDTTGNIAIGGAATSDAMFLNRKNVSGAATAYANRTQAAFQSDVTSYGYGYVSQMSTQAAAFTLTNLVNFYARGVSLGAGSAVTSQSGFYVENDLTAATNNYAFRSDLSAATGRYNLFMNGDAQNYLAGKLAVGGQPNSAAHVTFSGNITGATSAYELILNGTVQSDVTNTAYGIRSAIGTAATSFTLSNLHHFYTLGAPVGSGSTLTNQFGFSVDSGFTGATNNYAFRGAIPAGTGRYNIYMDGTAPNFLAGYLDVPEVRFGSGTYRRLGYVPSNGIYHGYNIVYDTSDARFEHESTGALSGIYPSNGGLLIFGNASQASGSAATERARFDLIGNLLLGLTSAGASSVGVIAMANGTAPSANVTGGQLYVEAGALKYRGSSGTVTTLAAA